MPATLDACFRLAEAYARVQRRFEHELGAVHGIGFSELVLLMQLGRDVEGRLSRADLAERLGLTASAAARALVPLERIGLVEREPDFENLRGGYVALTDVGRRKLEEALVTAGQISRYIYRDWPEAEVTGLDQLLSRLTLAASRTRQPGR